MRKLSILILSRNEKVEQRIRKKIYKLNALRFWVEGDVILLYGLAQFSFLFVSPVFTSSNYPTSGIRAAVTAVKMKGFDINLEQR